MAELIFSNGDCEKEDIEALAGAYRELFRLPADRRKGFSCMLKYTDGPQTKIRLVGYAKKDSAEGVVLAVSDGVSNDFATASDLILASFPADPHDVAAATNFLFCLGALNLAQIGVEVEVAATAVYRAEAHEVR